MISLGVWTCQYRELRPINFGGSATNPAGTSTDATNSGSAAVDGEVRGDEEQSYGRGRGRGRGRDGAGEYEMVALKGETSEAAS